MMDASQGSDGPDDSRPPFYNCVECLTPSPSLFKQYSTPAAVKLTRCRNCGNDVDPYVERETLLVSIDLVLHRTEAYRHALFNRDPFAGFRPSNAPSAVRRSAQIALVAAMLDGYLKFESARYRAFFFADPSPPGEEDALPPDLFWRSMIFSFSEHAVLVLGVVLGSLAGVSFDVAVESDLVSRLAVAVMIPSLFKFIVIFVHIWENTPTIRILGSLFVASMQWVAVQVAVERALFMSEHRAKNEPHRDEVKVISGVGCCRAAVGKVLRIAPGAPLLLGMLLRSSVPLIVSLLVGDPPSNRTFCSGFGVRVTSFGGEETLCLT
mmetsp:Transcript_5191/g.14983  ORF Transcript_5191/g.14983 Transcript_5191/m.14983 type:complete len:323 (-) Transcript_5191:30-998(-)